MIDIPHEPEKFLKWIIGFLIALFILWFLTGGPERFQEGKEGPFIEPPAPLSDGSTYWPDKTALVKLFD
ncbi:hypothetical protein COB64_00750 [Candidatus Wolfebacteria bacterium]|nr:MAG: hypothetical protein COB64_00750 [Candidatus Wolfebacteria bacterium]